MTRLYRYYINSIVILIFTLSLLPLIGSIPNVINELSNTNNRSQLKLVHVVFAHKLHAPLETENKYEFPQKLDFEYFLDNTSDMTNESKMQMFNLGEFIRQRYDEFLGRIYYPEVMEMRTSEYFLSMVSGLLVNAGLWPPVRAQKWKEDLDWQPIPTEYEQLEKDSLFLGTLCPRFLTEEQIMLEDESIKEEIAIHKPFFDYVTKSYGEKIEHPSQIAMLYSYFETIGGQENATLLPAWAEGIFPDGEMRNVSLLAYDLLSRSTTQKQLNGGGFLKKIIKDSKKIIPEKDMLPAKNNSRDLKLSMYSGEERNVVGVLQALNLWSPHIVENGASIILEFRYDETDDLYGFEIFYYTGIADNETIALNLPGCQAFCPLNDFARILDDVLPADENLLCHTVPSPNGVIHAGSTANSHHHWSMYLSHCFVPFITLLLSKF